MRPAHLPDRAGDLRRRLVDAREVCAGLGLVDGARGQSRGLLIRCPWHTERTPSCSVRVAADGTLAVKCFGCGTSGDVLSLVAAARGLHTRRDFPEVLRIAAELAGAVLEELPGAGLRSRPTPKRNPRPELPPFPRGVGSLWEGCRPVTDDSEVAGWLSSRALDPSMVEDRGLARALPLEATPPTWARFKGRTWTEAGYRCVLPMLDETGALRSVRVRRVANGEGPKAVPPTGFRAAGLVMADALGQLLLEMGRPPDFWPTGVPLRVIIAEGEPDFLTWATHYGDAAETAPAVIGITAGGWTDAIAARIPKGARVVIRTHHDGAGEQYARAIQVSLRGRLCSVVRGGARGCARCAEAGWTRGVA